MNDDKAVEQNLRDLVNEYFPRDAVQIIEEVRVAASSAPTFDDRDATLILGALRATFAEE